MRGTEIEPFEKDGFAYFYKYLPLDKEHIKSLDILSKATIKFTTPSELNDPFDCLASAVRVSAEDVLERLPGLVREISRRKGESPTQSKTNELRCAAIIAESNNDGSMQQRFRDNTGICSLSTDPLNALMWAHYAKEHTGFVVEIKTRLNCGSPDELQYLSPQKVDYKFDRPVFDPISVGSSDAYKGVVLTKPKAWSYENEWRVVILGESGKAGDIYNFNRDEVVTAVFEGLRMESEYREKLQEEVKKLNQGAMPDLKIYRVESCDTSYGLFLDGHPRLGKQNMSLDRKEANYED